LLVVTLMASPRLRRHLKPFIWGIRQDGMIYLAFRKPKFSPYESISLLLAMALDIQHAKPFEIFRGYGWALIPDLA
jgi:hypothetical protein